MSIRLNTERWLSGEGGGGVEDGGSRPRRSSAERVSGAWWQCGAAGEAAAVGLWPEESEEPNISRCRHV